MTMNNDDQARDKAGKFAATEGLKPEVGLEAPSAENSFLLPGKDCECDVDYRCPNHDLEAEEEFHRTAFYAKAERQAEDVSISLAYDDDDPKHPEYLKNMGL